MPNPQTEERRSRDDRSGRSREGRDRSEDGMRSRSERSTRSRGNDSHDHRTAKVVELVCSSTKSFEDAIRKGLEDAAETTRGITGCHVETMSIKCENGEIVSYRVNLKVAFGIERTPAP